MARGKTDQPVMLHEGIAKILKRTSQFQAVTDWISSGIDLLDWSITPTLQKGGFPCGRVVELYGDYSSGKTMIALAISRTVQRLGGHVVYVDAEHGLDKGWVHKLGVSTEQDVFTYVDPDYVEETIDVIEYVATQRSKVDAYTLIVWDSLAGGVPRGDGMSQKSADEASRIAGSAMPINKFLKRETVRIIRNSKVMILLLNQVRDAINARFPGSTSRPGGRSPKFWASVIMKASSDEKINPTTKKVTGQFMTCRVEKSKVDEPWRSASFPMFFNKGPDNGLSLLYFLEVQGILPKGSRKGDVIYRDKSWRKNELRDVMETNPAVLDDIRNIARAAYYKMTEERDDE